MYHQHCRFKFSTRCFTVLSGLLCLSAFWLAPSAAQTVQPSRKAADSLYEQGDYAASAVAYHQLTAYWLAQGEPDSAYLTQLWEAKSYIQQYLFTEARALLQPIYEGEPPAQDPGLLSRAYHETSYSLMGDGQLEEALALSEKSIEVEQGRTAVDSFQLAKFYEFKGFLLMQTGRGKKAKRWVNNAHQIRKALLPPTDKELGYSANTLFIVMDALGDLPAADSAISEAWEILSQQLPEEHPHLALVANNYATHLMDVGQPEKAKAFLLKAIASNQKGERLFPLVGDFVNLGLWYLKLGESETAEQYYAQAWAIADTLLPAPHSARTEVLDALGAAAYEKRELDKAEKWFELAMEEKDALFGENSVELAQSLYNMGLLAKEREDWARAGERFSRAYTIRAELLGGAHPKTADVLYEMGEIAWARQQPDTALQYLQESLRIYREKLGDSHHHTLANFLQLAEINLAKARYNRSERFWKMGWAAACGWEEVDDRQQIWPPQTGFSIQKLHPEVLRLLNFRLQVLLSNPTELRGSEIREAMLLFVAFHTWLPRFQALYTQNTAEGDVRGQIQRAYQQFAVLAYHILPKGTFDNQKWQNVLLSCIQASRGATIRANLNDRKAIRYAGVSDSLVQVGQQLKQQLQFSMAQQQALLPGTAEGKQLALQQQQLLQHWEAYSQHIRERFPQYYQSLYAASFPDAQGLRQILGERQHMVLAFFHLDSTLLAVKADRDTLQAQWLDLPRGWQDSLSRYRQVLQQAKSPGATAQLGHWLYQQLWQPLEIPPQQQVKILPDGPLCYLNFETLLTDLPQNPTEMRQWPWLLRQHCVYYGFGFLGQKTQAKSASGKVLGIAPGFQEELKSSYLQQLPPQSSPDSTFLQWLRTPWSLQFVAELPEKGWGESLTEDQATQPRLFAAASEAAVLHFGTHARMRNDQPLNSFLALYPLPEDPQSGYLYTHELYARQLRAQLAVLTACETGLGTFRQGEGVLSLAHAFRFAGCPSVVYSLWSIDDERSNVLAEAFYEALRAGKSSAEALQTAKLAYLEAVDEPTLAMPFYWGSLVLTGEDAPIDLETDGLFASGWGYAMLGLLLGGAALGWYRHRRKQLRARGAS